MVGKSTGAESNEWKQRLAKKLRNLFGEKKPVNSIYLLYGILLDRLPTSS
jgi:hypothetical protein